ncbi:unnamed protein product [Caenorhabditis sp. 36 PRJEB53466]|nr:unnamed protein product [Caenorhabditis sp. 36 PRJEB53466]
MSSDEEEEYDFTCNNLNLEGLLADYSESNSPIEAVAHQPVDFFAHNMEEEEKQKNLQFSLVNRDFGEFGVHQESDETQNLEKSEQLENNLLGDREQNNFRFENDDQTSIAKTLSQEKEDSTTHSSFGFFISSIKRKMEILSEHDESPQKKKFQDLSETDSTLGFNKNESNDCAFNREYQDQEFPQHFLEMSAGNQNSSDKEVSLDGPEGDLDYGRLESWENVTEVDVNEPIDLSFLEEGLVIEGTATLPFTDEELNALIGKDNQHTQHDSRDGLNDDDDNDDDFDRIF